MGPTGSRNDTWSECCPRRVQSQGAADILIYISYGFGRRSPSFFFLKRPSLLWLDSFLQEMSYEDVKSYLTKFIMTVETMLSFLLGKACKGY